MIYCGIDPGLHGAIAFYCESRGNAGIERCMFVHDLPTLKIAVKATRKQKDGTKKQIDSTRSEVDAYALAEIVKEYMAKDAVHAWAELVAARPTDSQVSAANFVGNAREIRGCLRALMIPYHQVAVRSWRSAVGIKMPPMKKLEPGEKRPPFDKGLVTAKATEFFPMLSHLWTGKNKEHHDRAEACLIAYYGYEVSR